jgi:hypothetical protein
MGTGWISMALFVGCLGAGGPPDTPVLTAIEAPPAATAPPARPVPQPATVPPDVPPGMGPVPPWMASGPPPFCCPPPPPPTPPPPIECPPEEPGCQCGPCWYVGLDYLLWFVRKIHVQPLVTSGSIFDPVPGALGQPHTQIAVGGTAGDRPFLQGARLTLGVNLDPEQTWAVEVNAFKMAQGGGSTRVTSSGFPGSPVLARPFYNVNAHQEDADPVAVTNMMAGSVAVDVPRNLFGGEANLRYNYVGSPLFSDRFILLGGFRFLKLDEKVGITETLQDLPGLGAPGNFYNLFERFSAHNQFYGGQIGLEFERHVGPVALDIVGKFAVGGTQQEVNNSAITVIRGIDAVNHVGPNRGLLVQPSNAGKFHRTVFSVVPDLEFNVALALNDHIRVGVGYQFLYWTGVNRAAYQIDRVVNVQALQPFDQVGTARPAAIFTSTGFWAQGLNARIEFAF